jgi:hypothetical protein
MSDDPKLPQAIGTGQVEAICQGCLRVRSFPSYAVANAARCESCSEDMCPCSNCQDTIARLRAGERDFGGLQRPITGWTAEAGAEAEAPSSGISLEDALTAAQAANGCREACRGDVLDCPCASAARVAVQEAAGHG